MQFGAYVREPEELSPDNGGGPIRRSGGVTTRSGEGMPPYGRPQMVYRTPHAAVYEPESGGARWPGIERMKFLPDGRLVEGTALGGADGSETSVSSGLFEMTQSAAARVVAAIAGRLGEVSSQDAAAAIQALYVALQTTFGNIVTVHRAAGKQIPCTLVDSYNRAVRSYIELSRTIIDRIYKSGGRVFQTVIDSQGNPVRDTAGNVKVREAFVPFRPGSFVVTGCPAGTTVAGALGFPVVAVAGIGAIVVLGVIALIKWEPERAAALKSQVNAINGLLQCQRDAVAAGAKGAEIDARCAALTKAVASSTKALEPGLGFWGWLGIGSAVAVAGGVLTAVIVKSARRRAPAAPASASAAGW